MEEASAEAEDSSALDEGSALDSSALDVGMSVASAPPATRVVVGMNSERVLEADSVSAEALEATSDADALSDALAVADETSAELVTEGCSVRLDFTSGAEDASAALVDSEAEAERVMVTFSVIVSVRNSVRIPVSFSGTESVLEGAGVMEDSAAEEVSLGIVDEAETPAVEDVAEDSAVSDDEGRSDAVEEGASVSTALGVA